MPKVVKPQQNDSNKSQPKQNKNNEDYVPRDITIPKNSLEVPKEILPTCGMFYDGPIYVSPLSVSDVKKISTIFTESNESITETIMNIIRKHTFGVDFNELDNEDIISIGYFIRTNTYPDSRFVIPTQCNNEVKTGKQDKNGDEKIEVCGNEHNVPISLDDLEITKLDEKFKDRIIEFQSDFSDLNIKIRIPKYGDNKRIQKNIEKFKKINHEEVYSDMVAFAVLMEEVNGEKGLVASNYQTLMEMPAHEMMQFESEVGELKYGVNHNLSYTCKKCGGRVDVPAWFSEYFFAPMFVKHESDK